MPEVLTVLDAFKKPCSCGKKHETTICDIQIASGLVHHVGEILTKNHFAPTLLLVADRNTLKAASGIEESLQGFLVEYKIYDDLRVATMEHVEELETLIKGRDVSVLAVGTGSVHDPCRLACARQNKKLCVFATAPSMDGFASYNAPIVSGGFKTTHAAKSPEVVIGDTKILASAPMALKSAGFGDMIAKYVGLIDWQVSVLLTGEYYCERVAALTKSAVDELMAMADRVTANDEETAGKIFESLLKTGIAMSYTQNSRPASGSEHIIAHLIECVELRDGIIPNFHGEDVGVCSLEMLRYYNELAKHESIDTCTEAVDWDDVYTFYGNMAEEVRRLNEPDNIIDSVDKDMLKENWQKIRDIIHSMPDYETCKCAMEQAGCKLTYDDIEKDETLFKNCVAYSPYMRRRLTLLRLKNMIILEGQEK